MTEFFNEDFKNSGNKTNTGRCRDYPGIMMGFEDFHI